MSRTIGGTTMQEGTACVPRSPSFPRRVPILLFVGLVAVACDAGEPPVPTIAIDSAGVRIVTSDPATFTAACTLGEAPIFRVGDDESDDKQWFSSVRGVGRLSDGSVAVADRTSAEVRIFAPDGRHLRSMGRHGEGPGEFQDPFVLWVLPGDTIWVGDYRPWRYVVFTAEGEWVRNVTLDPIYPNPARGGGVLDNGVSVNALERLPRARDFRTPDTMVAEVHDRDGQRVGVLSRFPTRRLGRAPDTEAYNYYIGVLFDPIAMVDARQRTIALAHTATPEVRLLDEAFNLRSIVRWHVPDQAVTSGDVRVWREEFIRRRTTGGSIWDDDYDGPMINPKRPVADIMPAISTLQVGRDGRLWVWPYRRPGAGPTRAMAFSPDGEFLCHLERPGESASFSVYEFGADYALGVSTSDLGIETVVVHALGLPGES